MTNYILRAAVGLGLMAAISCVTPAESTRTIVRREPDNYQSQVACFAPTGRKIGNSANSDDPLERTVLRLVRPITIYSPPEERSIAEFVEGPKPGTYTSTEAGIGTLRVH